MLFLDFEEIYHLKGKGKEEKYRIKNKMQIKNRLKKIKVVKSLWF